MISKAKELSYLLPTYPPANAPGIAPNNPFFSLLLSALRYDVAPDN